MAIAEGNAQHFSPTLSGQSGGPGLGARERWILGAALVGIVTWGFIGVDYDSRFEPGETRRPTRARPAAAAPSAIAALDPMAHRGAAVFEANGCGACHSVDGSARIGPSLVGIWGTEQSMQDGTIAVVDGPYVRESILSPQAREVDGYDAQMPSYEGLVTEDDLDALTAYLRSLR